MEGRATKAGVQAHAQLKAYTDWAEYHSQQDPMAVFYDTKEQHMAEVCRTLWATGYVAQFGVDAGHTLRIMASHFRSQKVIGFDAWHTKGPGLPDRWTGNFDFSRAFTWTRDAFRDMKRTMPRNVKLVPGLFDKQKIQDALPKGDAALISIDCDTGASTTTVLEAVRHTLGPGTRIIFDEYCNYAGWRQHEFGAWQSFCEKYQIEYEYFGICDMDVSVEITDIKG